MENVGFYLEIFNIIMIITLTHQMDFFFFACPVECWESLIHISPACE